jgi:hypothetical protein
MAYLFFSGKRIGEARRRGGVQCLAQFFYPPLYARVKWIFFGKGLINFVGLLEMTLFEINLSQCFCHQLIHLAYLLEVPYQKLGNNLAKVNPFDLLTGS